MLFIDGKDMQNIDTKINKKKRQTNKWKVETKHLNVYADGIILK